MLDECVIGQRVVIRYRHGTSLIDRAQSDVTGYLIYVDHRVARIEARTGVVEVDREAIVAARTVSASRRDVLTLEGVAALGWRAARTVDLEGWILRADAGWTRRANSCLPLSSPSRPVAELIAGVERFYAERDLPARISVAPLARGLLDAELARRGWTIEAPAIVSTTSLDALGVRRPSTSRVELQPTASPEWFAAQGNPPASGQALLSRHEQVRFGSVEQDGRVVAVARGTIDTGWLGITSVVVDPAARRRGYASDLLLALGRWAMAEGAERCYVQIEADNTGAQSLYKGLGFVEHHRYHYRRRP